jgi:homoserine dehydrogenase
MNKQTIKIGLFGFGCVGQGLYDVLHQTRGIKAEISRICVKDKNKQRSLPASSFTFDKNDILNDSSIDVVVELIDNAEEAFEIVTTALKNGKSVVTANKKMLAENFKTIYALQQVTKRQVLYEGAVCAAIPIIRTLEEYYDNDLLSSVEGIFNGTTNYILTKTVEENKTYEQALKQAQELGFAESNPRLDVEGYDPKYKLTILAAHAFGLFVKPEEVLNVGIHHLSPNDVVYANEKGLKLKLVPHLQKQADAVVGYVLPQFVDESNPLYHINNEFNAVGVQAAFADKQFFTGRGAGSIPTGAAVLSDISALTYNYKYEYKKAGQQNGLSFTNEHRIKAYIRFTQKEVLDELEVQNIEETYQSKDYKYVIGEVKISKLLEAGLNQRRDVFVAKVGEAETSAREKAAATYEALETVEF